jgi:hypothetical protein
VDDLVGVTLGIATRDTNVLHPSGLDFLDKNEVQRWSSSQDDDGSHLRLHPDDIVREAIYTNNPIEARPSHRFH